MQAEARSIWLRLEDILKAAEAARRIVGTRSLAEFRTEEVIQLATERCLEVISEASRYVPDETKAEFPAIPWRQIANIGNVLRHVYQHVDSDVIWGIVQKEVPELEAVIRTILARMPSSDSPGNHT